MKSVASDLQLSDEDAFFLIENMINCIGREQFTKRLLIENLTDEQILVIINYMEHEKIITTEVSYECPVFNESSETIPSANKCEFCEGNLMGDIDHEVEFIYHLKDNAYKDVLKWLKEKEEERYFKHEFLDNLKRLKEASNRIIPFIGAGLSLPFGIPNWRGLIERLSPSFEKNYQNEMFDDLMDSGDFMEALELIKDKSYLITGEKQLQTKVVEIIKNTQLSYVEEREHNYSDIVKLESNFYLTTNYDLILSKYLSKFNEYTSAMNFNEFDDSQELHIGSNQVLHLHGNIKQKESMVVSKKSYEKFYSDNDNNFRFVSLIGSKPLLFLGFSFNDAFFEDLYNKIYNVISGNHYIVVANPNFDTARELAKKNLKVIGLNIKKNKNDGTDSQDYVKALKVLIRYLTNDNGT
ncbi:SIR2 family NAD-dependent protein deacylase [Evansella cellulosilytica]|nr:SIR2 family protein [Evansella cellulosilytica]